MMVVAGVAGTLHVWSYLAIQALPVKSKHYNVLIWPKVKEAAPITGALMGSMIAISHSSFFVAQRNQCMTSVGWSWTTTASFPTLRMLARPGFLAAHILGAVFIGLSLYGNNKVSRA